ncbi:MAG: ThuA domain-containing protein [Verrucomicrobiaceae bacterium]|nr:ThuA domain-containing protein [Verrucomicrobiaceae bacterium]
MKCIVLLLCSLVSAVFAAEPIRVLVWDEQQPEQKQGYGEKFLGETLAAQLAKLPGLSVKTAKLDEADQGLSDAALDATDVLIFWCHRRVKDQDDARMEAVVKRVMEGQIGFIGLHSTHWGKPFVRLMQERTKADAVKALPAAERATAKWEFLNDAPYYKGVGRAARVTPFVEKGPDEVVFEEKWDKGEHFRSGCVWQVGKGRVFYFRPGHETYGIFQQAETQRVVENAVRWMGGAVK